ncbi:hypothetical protein F2Q69_00023766 [Brassica cretica]|uniref:Uncharacterized protein n=1 Tax=Brassica cretica TaxID=69181 RepID=A0A8S9PYX6_BRACR|nr:hypothetical protein F2Q69_00023766 [Brassica cretica]
MAPEKTSQQPDMETKLESEPKPNQEPEEGDDLDPAKSIKKIRTIVETLHTLSPPQLPNLTKSRSIPPPAPSVPVGTSLNHDESENSVHKLKRNLRLLSTGGGWNHQNSVDQRKPGGLDSEDGEVENNGKGIECLPGIHANEEDLKRLAVFRQLKEKFMDLRILPVGVKPEDAVKDILKEFMEKKLIEPVENKRKVKPNCYKMTPFVHSSVVLISEEI